MTTLYEGAFAKINLTLDVLGKRADGYHDLQSVMQTISIRDDVEIDVGTGKPWRLLCSVEGIPTDEKNLAWKAAKVYCDAMDKDPEGLEIRIVKRIPAGAEPALWRPAVRSGAGGTGRTGWQRRSVLRGGRHGHGGRPGRAPEKAAGYARLPVRGVQAGLLRVHARAVWENRHRGDSHRPDNQAMESALLAGDLGKVAENVYNVFDPVVTSEHLELNYIKSICNSYGALTEQMTGSGSAIFAILPNFEYAAVVCSMLKENYPNIYIAKPV